MVDGLTARHKGVDSDGAGMPLDAGKADGVAVAFGAKDSAPQASIDVAPTLRAMGHRDSHANAGGQVAVAIQEREERERDSQQNGRGFQDDGSAYTLEARATPHAVAVSPATIRRITPLEAERLMGFPDYWTAVEHRGKPMADGPRYRLLGNSMAVNVMRWIGERIGMADEIPGRFGASP